MANSNQVVSCMCLVAASFTADRPAHADPGKVKESIVTVTVRGVSPSQGNALVSEQGTGFFIHPDGYLVTSYHLLGNLGDVSPGSVVYSVHFGSSAESASDAYPLFLGQQLDVMVLAVPTSDHGKPPIAWSNHDGVVPGVTDVFTVGYPAGATFTVAKGTIRSFHGSMTPPLPWWTAEMTFQSGQSGSPILTADNKVIGIVKGSDASQSSVGYIVPITFVPSNFWGAIESLSSATQDALKTGRLDRLVVQVQPAQKVRLERVANFTLLNDPCAKTTIKARRLEASKGGRIERESVQLHVTSIAGAAASPNVDSQPGAITVSAILKNAGSCSPTTRDTPATTSGRVTYAEMIEPQSAPLVTYAEATNTPNMRIPLPAVAAGKVTLTAIAASGQQVSFEPTNAEISTAGGQRFLDVNAALNRALNGSAKVSLPNAPAP